MWTYIISTTKLRDIFSSDKWLAMSCEGSKIMACRIEIPMFYTTKKPSVGWIGTFNSERSRHRLEDNTNSV